MSHQPLTTADVFAYAAIVAGCAETARTRILMEGGNVLDGNMRYLDGDQGAPRPADVRDAFVRVTSRSGTEHWFPFKELAWKASHGEMSIGS